MEGIICYMTFFLVVLILVHYFDTKRIVQRKSVIIATSLISIAIDLSIISLSELIVLYTIQMLPQDISKGIGIRFTKRMLPDFRECDGSSK